MISINPKSQSGFLFEIAGEGSTLHRKHKVYLDWVGIAQIPENYDERLTEIFGDTFKHIRFFALDPYDIALAKIERNIQRDRDDVKHLAMVVPFDLEILKLRYKTELSAALFKFSGVLRMFRVVP